MMQALRGPSGVLLGALVAGIAGLVTWLALAPGERAANEVVQVGPAGHRGSGHGEDRESREKDAAGAHRDDGGQREGASAALRHGGVAVRW